MGTRQLTVDGNESTFQINHLAPFLLTTGLMDVLTASNEGHQHGQRRNDFGKLDLFDLNAEHSYSTTAPMAQPSWPISSLRPSCTGASASRELRRRHSTRAWSAPTSRRTPPARSGTPTRTLLNRFMLTPDQGADTLLWLINGTAGTDWISGAYYAKRALAKANAQAYDAGLAQGLWEASEALVMTSN